MAGNGGRIGSLAARSDVPAPRRPQTDGSQGVASNLGPMASQSSASDLGERVTLPR